LHDPNDEHVLECAVNGGANALVTDNIRDFRSANSFGVKVVTPSEFLGILEDRSKHP